ncbi:sensor histidine kinase [Aureimonas mangrovi]|uniref:sensor histidine kinase n=1 Tax=Aureimonas mangrovi TaxID=2758041 RepID=UPI00163D6B8E|nr:HAMP domain-containing sensor histidine kinase [Aureimonas mangrovi]
MHESGTRSGKGEAIGGLEPLVGLFEGFVSLDIDRPDERRRHARAILALTGAGLSFMAASAVMGVSGAHISTVLVPSAAAALSLAAAVAVCATGRLRLVSSVALAALGAAGGFGMMEGGQAAWLGAGALGAAALGAGALALRALKGRRPSAPASVGDAGLGASLARLLDGPLLRFDLDGRLAEVPAEAAPLFGAVQDKALVERIHLLDRVAYLGAFADLRRGAASAEAEIRLMKGEEEGGERQVLLRLAATHDANGEPVCVYGVARDVSEERAQARRLAVTLTRAEEASQAKSRFLASISHELRTPLNAIIGFTDILEHEYFGGFESARQKEYVGLIGRSGQHLLDVVNGLLDISKIEAGRYEITPERFALHEAMEAAAAMVRPEAERKGLVLIVQEPGTDAEFHADRRAFHQILLNLLSNAVKFTDEGTVRLSARCEGGAQIVEIEDTGIGIAAADVTRIAQPFVRVAPSQRPGTGLGLSLVKGLCELHRGALRVESRPGVGTTVGVTIPLDCDAAIGEHNLKEKIVSLTDARKKTVPLPQAQTGRRSA